MKITDEASKMMREALESNHCTGIQLSLQESCCGTSLAFNLIQLEGDSYTTVNGVPVVMDTATKEWTEDVTIELANGRLALRREGGCCC